MRKLAVMAALAILAMAPAFAEDWDFVLINRTGQGIRTIALAPAGTVTWQANKPDPDRTGAPITETGARMIVHFDKGPGCRYDIKATFVDGASAIWTGIDVCDNAFVTLSVDAEGKATFKAN